MVSEEVFISGYTYEGYRELVARLAATGDTTGPEKSAERIDFTKLNSQRMHRLDKTIVLAQNTLQSLNTLRCRINWLVLSESWCGDAAQNVPVLAKMAEASPFIELRVILRDEHLDIMDQFLTNGGRAIPKLIILNHEFKVTGAWGPRPSEIQAMVMENRRTGGVPYSEFALTVQKWYLENKGVALQREMLAEMERAGCLQPALSTVS